MGFRKAPKQPPFFPHKDRQVIFVEPTVFFIVVFPDETAVIPVFRDGTVPDHRPVFIRRIKVKQKQPSGIQIIVHQRKRLFQLLFFQQIIEGIADADYGPHRAVKLKFAHILLQIEDIQPGLFLFFQGDIQHPAGQIHPDHIVPGPRQPLRHAAGAAA